MPKSLKKETRQNLVAWLKRYRDEFFPVEERERGWQAQAAETLKTSTATISRLMGAEPQGGSQELIESLAAVFDVSPSQIMFGTEQGDDELPRLRSHAEFASVLEQAQREAKANRMNIPASAWKKVGDVRAKGMPPLTPQVVLHIAIAYAQSSDATRG